MVGDLRAGVQGTFLTYQQEITLYGQGMSQSYEDDVSGFGIGWDIYYIYSYVYAYIYI